MSIYIFSINYNIMPRLDTKYPRNFVKMLKTLRKYYSVCLSEYCQFSTFNMILKLY